MIPLAAVVVLGITVTCCTFTFIIAIYTTISSRLKSRNKGAAGQEKLWWRPSTEDVAIPATMVQNAQHIRAPTPEAESPPPLSPCLEEKMTMNSQAPQVANRTSVQSMYEIIDMYFRDIRKLQLAPQSAPANIGSFAQAVSKKDSAQPPQKSHHLEF